MEMKKLVSSIKENEEQFEIWKEYLRLKCKLDEKVKNGEAVLISTVAFVFSAMSCFSNIMKNMNIVILLCISVMMIGVLIIAFGIVKPYLKNYIRERTFYELLLYYAENA